jgi:PAS domain S-box-containing protein
MMVDGGAGAVRGGEVVTARELDRGRHARNTHTLSLGLALVSGVMLVPLAVVGVDARVLVVTAAALGPFAGCAWLSRRYERLAPVALNAFLHAMIFAGVVVNKQIGPGPAFVGFSLFVAAATLPLRGVLIAGVVGVLNVVAMWAICRQEPQLAEPPGVAVTYGLTLCGVTTLLSVVQSINARRTLEQVVERERRALAAEARAHESESRYRLITDNTSDLVALLDQGGRFLYASPSFERILGLRPADVIGKLRTDFMAPEDFQRATGDLMEALAHGSARGLYRCIDGKGRPLFIECVYDAVDHSDPKLVAMAARDVTEKRALASQLQQAQKMDALGRMAAVVAHDFNNMLTVISSAISIARTELPEGSMGGEALEDGAKSATSAAALTSRLLAFSRQSPTVAESVDARKALGGAAQLLPHALGHKIALRIDIGDGLPTIAASQVQLEQLLLNLALNARDAMPDGGELSIRARERRLAAGEEGDLRPGRWLELVVRDTGTGMTDEVKARLFEPFFTTKPAGRGTGLGLSTCYGIVKQLGGVIRVESEVGKGTTFTVLVPETPGVAAAAPQAKSA